MHIIYYIMHNYFKYNNIYYNSYCLTIADQSRSDKNRLRK